MKIAVFLAPGYEEGESLFVVDILRRAGFQSESVSVNGDLFVTGAQGITVKADRVIGDDIRDYDMIVLPGGQPGANNLASNNEIIELIRYFDANNKYIAAICAAPMVLHVAGIDSGRTLTSYPADKYKVLFTESTYIDDAVVVVDNNIITSRGPATTLPFAYKLVEILGGNAEALKEKMQYNFVMSRNV